MYKRILIVVDPHPAAQSAVSEGIALARRHRAEIVFYAVLPQPPLPLLDLAPVETPSPQAFAREARAEAAQVLARARAQADDAGVLSHEVLGRGENVPRAIVEAARKRRCELIVVPCEGSNAFMRIVTGSVVPGLITASTLPLLVCKSRAPHDAATAVGAESTALAPPDAEPPRTARSSAPA